MSQPDDAQHYDCACTNQLENVAGGLALFAKQRIRLAAAGYRHLVVMAEDGYGIYGQLGLGDEQRWQWLTRETTAAFAESRVMMVACGSDHTMAAGQSWTTYGQLGMGDRTSRLLMTQVDAGQLGGARTVMAACGLARSKVLSAEGRVWTFGYGWEGRRRAGRGGTAADGGAEDERGDLRPGEGG